MLKGIFSSLHVLNKKIKVALGWHVDPPTCYVVSCKKLRDESLHTFWGIVGYSTMGHVQDRFEYLNHNVYVDDTNEGKMEYVKLGKVGLKNLVSLFHNNILQRAH